MRRLLLLPLAVLALGLAGCASSRDVSYGDLGPDVHVEARLRAAARAWEGTPHRWGGTDRRGVDCSGLVLTVYEDLFGLGLPRTTEAQARIGTAVRPDALRPGDLVFFRPGKDRHVGIYLGDGEFFHASASRGVMTSALDEPYWRQAYWTARRPLTAHAEPARPSTPSPVLQAPSSTARPSRSGW